MAKLSWGIEHAATETIYKGAILPLLTYGAPVESCSDHSILKYVLGNSTSQWTGVNTEGVRYKVTKKDSDKFQVNLLQLMKQRFCGSNSEVGETEELDKTLRLRVAKAPNMETIVEELHDVLASACSS